MSSQPLDSVAEQLRTAIHNFQQSGIGPHHAEALVKALDVWLSARMASITLPTPKPSGKKAK